VQQCTHSRAVGHMHASVQKRCHAPYTNPVWCELIMHMCTHTRTNVCTDTHTHTHTHTNTHLYTHAHTPHTHANRFGGSNRRLEYRSHLHQPAASGGCVYIICRDACACSCWRTQRACVYMHMHAHAHTRTFMSHKCHTGLCVSVFVCEGQVSIRLSARSCAQSAGGAMPRL